MATTSHQDELGEDSSEESNEKGPRPPWWWSGVVQIICVVVSADGVELMLQIVERLAS